MLRILAREGTIMPPMRRNRATSANIQRRRADVGSLPAIVPTAGAWLNRLITAGACGIVAMGAVALYVLWAPPERVVGGPRSAEVATTLPPGIPAVHALAPRIAPMAAAVPDPPRSFARGGGDDVTIAGHRWLGHDAGDPPSRALERARAGMRERGLDPAALVQDQDGVHAHLARSSLADLGFLEGLPIVELDLNDSSVGDLSGLGGMPLRRLLLNNVRVADLSVVRGMPLQELHAADCGLVDVGALAGMPLTILEAGHNPFSDLRPLAGAPIHALFIQETQVEDLRPLATMPLEELDAGSTRVRDLSPLAGLPIRRLLLSRCPVTSLAPLANMPLRSLGLVGIDAPFEALNGLALEELWLGDSSISDLAPLAGMPLRLLDIGDCRIPTLAPLAGAGLQVLLMENSPIADLSPLAGLPLAELDLHGCGQVRSLEPLSRIATLRRLSLPPGEPGLESLRNLAGVQVRGSASDSALGIQAYIDLVRGTGTGQR